MNCLVSRHTGKLWLGHNTLLSETALGLQNAALTFSRKYFMAKKHGASSDSQQVIITGHTSQK